MRILVITQKINIADDILGFMHGWIMEFAKHCEKVTVICLEKGEFSFPKNVSVVSLGKERLSAAGDNIASGWLRKLTYTANFFKYIWQERNNYDNVFVHMNDEYVAMGGILWRALGKKIGLWYAHGHVPFSLRIAEKLTHIIFTSTRSGCRLNSKKIKVVGQGIDTDKFLKSIIREDERGAEKESAEIIGQGEFRILTIGRISPSKDYETLIRAIEILVKDGLELKADIVGGIGTPDQEKYLADQKKMVKERCLEEVINFKGSMPNREIVTALNKADLFVNMGLTGSLDKAILEAMAAGLPVLTCNEALKEVIGDYKEMLMYGKRDYVELSEKIKIILHLKTEERTKLGLNLREIVVGNHNLGGLVQKIIQSYGLA